MDANGDIVRVTVEPIVMEALLAVVRTDASGALAAFVGVVRDESEGRRVDAILYEAYLPMAEEEMLRIAAEARGRWDLQRIAVVHRTGRLAVGEASVAIVVAAAHRREALEACAFLIDKLKQTVPIWKKEFGGERGRWVVGVDGREPT